MTRPAGGAILLPAAFCVSGRRKSVVDQKRIAARLAKVMGLICERNSKLENVHAGVIPVTKAGDYSDVIVLDAEGRRIPWTDVSHINDDQMLWLMMDIVNRLYTFQRRIDDPEFHAWIDRWASVAEKWDNPEFDQGLIES